MNGLTLVMAVARYGWRVTNGCTRQSLAENAVSRFKALFGTKLSARRFDNQRTEAMVKCAALNRMTHLGMHQSVRIHGRVEEEAELRPWSEWCNNAPPTLPVDPSIAVPFAAAGRPFVRPVCLKWTQLE